MFELSREEMLGKVPLKDVRYKELMGLVKDVSSSQKKAKTEFKIVSPEEKILAAYAGPIKGDSRDVYGVIVVLHDITEQRKLENYRSEFVANVSHELKTPLTAIRSYVETLLEGAINDQERNVGFLQKIEKHTAGLSALIDDILEIYRLESRSEISPFAPVDLEKVVSRSLDTVMEKARKKNVALEKRCEAIVVSGVEDHIYRALLNLLDNAINFTAEGGKIEIAAERKNGGVELSVSDSGMGIASGHLPRLFERFYRVDKARSREYGGTGLGLAIVKHVMEVHNGKVSVESELGKGSRFILFFPASV